MQFIITEGKCSFSFDFFTPNSTLKGENSTVVCPTNSVVPLKARDLLHNQSLTLTISMENTRYSAVIEFSQSSFRALETLFTLHQLSGTERRVVNVSI